MSGQKWMWFTIDSSYSHRFLILVFQLQIVLFVLHYRNSLQSNWIILDLPTVSLLQHSRSCCAWRFFVLVHWTAQSLCLLISRQFVILLVAWRFLSGKSVFMVCAFCLSYFYFVFKDRKRELPITPLKGVPDSVFRRYPNSSFGKSSLVPELNNLVFTAQLHSINKVCGWICSEYFRFKHLIVRREDNCWICIPFNTTGIFHSGYSVPKLVAARLFLLKLGLSVLTFSSSRLICSLNNVGIARLQAFPLCTLPKALPHYVNVFL